MESLGGWNILIAFAWAYFVQVLFSFIVNKSIYTRSFVLKGAYDQATSIWTSLLHIIFQTKI